MNNPYFALLKRSWKYADENRKRYVLIYVSFIIYNGLLALNPLLFGWLVNELQKGVSIYSKVWIYVGIFMGMHLVASAIQGFTRVQERKLGFIIGRNLLYDYFHKLLQLPMKWHKKNHSGTTINRLKKAYISIGEFFENGFFYLMTFSQFFFSLIGMLVFSTVAGLASLLLGFIMVIVMTKFDKPFIKHLKELNEKEHNLASGMTDAISNIFTVITLRLGQRMKVDLNSRYSSMYGPFSKNIVVNEWKWFTANVLVWIIYLIMVIGYIYGHYVPGETFMVGGLVALLGYVNQFTGSFGQMAQAYTQILNFNTDIQTVDLIDEAYYQETGEDSKKTIPSGWKQIKIENLLYSHTSSETNPEGIKARLDELHDGVSEIELQLVKGGKIALIGESGSGKSTILSLLGGLYTAAEGTVVNIDGDQDYRLKNLAPIVTLFPQEPEIFENTILYNITLGLPFSEVEINDACELVGFDSVVSQLPDGLNTFINEKGVNLSVGQKQRLALARGILASQQSQIILLDEPTSSVDSRTALVIYERIFNAFKDKLIVSSLHNLSLLPHFEFVYALERGKIVESGPVEMFLKGDYLKTRATPMSQNG